MKIAHYMNNNNEWAGSQSPLIWKEEPDDLMLEFETVYAVLADNSSQQFLRMPPDSFSVWVMLESMKDAEPCSEYGCHKNRLIEELLENNKPSFLARCCDVEHAK